MKKTAETDLVRACIKYLLLKGCTVWRQNTGAMRIGKRFIRFSKPGTPDIIGYTATGRFIGIECKRRPRKPTPKQQAWLIAAYYAGCIVQCVYSLEELEAFIKKCIL